MQSSEHDIADIDRFQNTLRTLLNAYVNGEYLRRVARYGYPLLWQLSPYRVGQAIHELTRAALPLRQNPGVAQLLDDLRDQAQNMATSPESVLVEALALSYRCLKQILVERSDTTCTPLPKAKPFCAQTYLELDRDYFRPVVALARYCTDILSRYLTDAWIHGSVADLGLAKGYSDLDVLYVLSEQTVTDPGRLRSFARKCYRGHVFLYAFDPLQHHGYQITTAIDWLAYPQSWLPLETLRAGITLLCQTESVRIRDSQIDAQEAFETTVDHFVRLAQRNQVPSDAYEFKYFLSVLMLLPTLFWQAKGDFGTKRDSFVKLGTLGAEFDRSVIDAASRIRAQWPDLQPPFMLRFLHPRVLAALSASRTQAVLETRPGAMAEDAASLAIRLHELVEDEQNEQLKRMSPPLAITNVPVRYSLADYDAARECYVKQVANERGVVAVLEFGGVSEPGLSDLDFVVVVDDGAPIHADGLSIRGLSLAHADLIMHEPLVVPLSLAAILQESLPLSRISILYQRDRVFETPLRDRSGGGPYSLIACLLERLYGFRHWFSTVMQSNVLDARWGLAVMKSLQYSVLIIENMTGTPLAAAASYVADLQALRATWFGIDQQLWRRERLRLLHWRGQALFQESLAATEAHLLSQMRLGVDGQNTATVLDRLLGLYAREVPLSRMLRKAPGPSPSTPFERYLSQRAGILAQQQRFLSARGLTFGSLI